MAKLSTSSARPTDLTTRIFVSFFCLIFLGFGGWLLWALGNDLLLTIDSRSWQETTCSIESSHVQVPSSSEDDFVFTVSYRYSAGGQERVGDRYQFGYWGSSEASDAYKLQEAYPAATKAPCWFDPDEPDESFLVHRSFAHASWLLLPLLLLAVGAAGLYWLWFWRPAEEPESELAALTRSEPEEKDKAAIPGCMILFFGVFLAAGLLVLWFTLILPLTDILAARSWTERDCEVITSRVRTHPGDSDSEDTYSVDILYRYRVDGREYHSNRYDFQRGSTSGYESKARVVEQYRPGSRFVCWVDPDDPAEAVIQRGYSWSLLFSLLGLPFALVGAGGIWWMLRSRRKARSGELTLPEQDDSASADDPEPIPFGPRTLTPKLGRVGKLLAVIAIAAFWNGITGVFVWQAIESWRQGAPDGCLTVFILPFVAIGLILIAGIPYTFLAMFNPRPVLTIDPPILTAGESVLVTWSFRGSTRRIRKLRIRLVAKRSARKTEDGESSQSVAEEIHSIDVIDTESQSDLAHGSTTVTLPEDVEPSSKTSTAQVTWNAKIQGEIAWWPDVLEEIEIEVRPAERPPIPPPPDAWSPPAADL